MKDSRLTHLCITAHKLALTRGVLTPAERPEFMHHRVIWVTDADGSRVPVLDSARMRMDQLDEVTDRLERMIGTRRATNTFEMVADYLQAYGRFGLRRQDIATALSIDEKSVRNALTRLQEEGRVMFKEEKTRGKGTARKRWVWLDTKIDYGADDQVALDDETTLSRVTDVVAADDTGVRYHGTAVQAVTCRCASCRDALETWAADQEASLDRRRGGTGYLPRLQLMQERRRG